MGYTGRQVNHILILNTVDEATEAKHPLAAVERIWHRYHSQGQILALAFRYNSLQILALAFRYNSLKVFDGFKVFARERNLQDIETALLISLAGEPHVDPGHD